jgi:UDP-2-acetamido-3-amino-2,3-dideoxy-glucuronate N-acetyltransferase|tara:strand:+ start:8280 stop:8768 length:489 start_codon:yes stop_codon:yes gene_type:complete
MPHNHAIDLQNGSVAWSPCHIGKGLTVGSDCSIGALSHIGRNVTVGDACRIQGGAYIADGCVLASEVFIGPNATLLNDRYPPSKDSEKWAPVHVAAKAVIGGGATIIAGLKVGENAVLGAGSTLTKDLPANEVWVGNPAKRLMTRSEYEQKGGRSATDQRGI